MKLTDTQKEQILKTRDTVAVIQKTCDELYDKLITEIGFDKYSARSMEDLVNNVSNPVSWVFDIVFNTEFEADLQESFEALERSTTTYDTTI
jgi:hypothetical protein